MTVLTRPGIDRADLLVVESIAPFGPGRASNDLGTRRGVSMPRKSTGKRLRFKVFERDRYTCRYCGAQPPDIVLVLDHVIPVVGEGPTTADNLVAACETCNQGKAARRLGEAPPAPDADLLYLKTQQEIGELRRYRDAVEEREQLLTRVVECLQEVWIESAGEDLGWHPVDWVLRQMITKYDPSIVEWALRDVAPKVSSGYVEQYKWVPYLWAVCRTMEAQAWPEPV